jgi:hypothetical protein
VRVDDVAGNICQALPRALRGALIQRLLRAALRQRPDTSFNVLSGIP